MFILHASSGHNKGTIEMFTGNFESLTLTLVHKVEWNVLMKKVKYDLRSLERDFSLEWKNEKKWKKNYQEN